VNHVGAQTELIFDGGSLVMNADGTVCDELPYFEEAVEYFKIQNSTLKIQKVTEGIEAKTINLSSLSKIGLIHDALVLGIKDYFRKLGFQKAILGLSGGIDSAIVICLAEKALGKENVWAVLMPSQFSSDHSVNDALQLAENLGVKHDIIPIKNGFEALLETLQPQFKDLPFGLAEENLQARIRGNILMALSNKFGYILLNTSNKSEAAVGYGTLYGDMCGGLAVIADIYKNEVYELARYINRDAEIIPENIITKAPSAELRPNQKDSDSLPDYDILDQILFQYIEQRKGPKEIVAMGFDSDLVSRILKLVNISEYKRHQAPPILRVSPKAFGMGRRMPIEGRYLS
jgi:NAD+ synthase (glutamine-hydrolysing)